MPGSLTTPGLPGTRDYALSSLAFRFRYSVGIREGGSFAAQWLAYTLPCRRFACSLADAYARLGANVVRYTFIAMDLHHLLLAGLYRRTPNILSALRRLLRNEGYRILTASGGAEALDILARESVQVVMSDHRMPGMTGSDFLHRVRDLYPDSVRILLTGQADMEAVICAINDGAVFKFLPKPWSDTHLRDRLREAFRFQNALAHAHTEKYS